METKVSARVRKALQKKVDDHNAKHGGDARKKATLRMLIAVFKRGVGAYNTNPQSVRPSVCLLYTSPSPRDRTRSRMPSSA